MIEVTTYANRRAAIERAHAERGAAINMFFTRLFGRDANRHKAAERPK